MTRAEFLAGIVQRDRNVIQKIERVGAARVEIGHWNAESHAHVMAEQAYANAQNDLDAALTERNDFIADYVDRKSSVSSHSPSSCDLNTSVESDVGTCCGKDEAAGSVGDASDTLGNPEE